MSDQQKELNQIEQEALVSWREWPIYIVLRLKNLQEIQQKLRIQGETPSQLVRRDQMLKAVHDQPTSAPTPTESNERVNQPTSETTSEARASASSDAEDDDFFEVVSYED
jgi:hypothetical protein